MMNAINQMVKQCARMVSKVPGWSAEPVAKMCSRLEHMTFMLKGGDAGVVAIENTPCGGAISMLKQLLFILTSTRQPTPVVLSTDTALFSRAVLAHTTNPRNTSPQARFQHSPIAQRATQVRITQSGHSIAEACMWRVI